MKKDLVVAGCLFLLALLLAIIISAIWGTSKKIGFVEIRGTFSIINFILMPFTYLGMVIVWKWFTKKLR